MLWSSRDWHFYSDTQILKRKGESIIEDETRLALPEGHADPLFRLSGPSPDRGMSEGGFVRSRPGLRESREFAARSPAETFV